MAADRSTSLDNWGAILAFSAAAVTAQILLGGVRPVDGSILAQFARQGFSAELAPFSQYLFDSPLKIAFLRMIGLQSPVALTLAFTLLSLLPFVAVLLAREDETRKTGFVLLAALPLTRISFDSLGIGDSVILAAVVVILVGTSRSLIAVVAALLVAWHFQQGVLLLLSISATILLCGEERERTKLAPVIAGLFAGVLVYVAARLWLLPPYQGRAGFLLQHLDRFLLRMVFYWPAALAIALPGALALWLARGFRGIHWTIAASLAVAFVVSGITSDVSRVFFVLSFPAVLHGLLVLQPVPHAELRRLGLLVPVLALSAAVPLLGWSGVEIYDWKGLADAMGKYWGASRWLQLFRELAGAFG